MSDTENTSTSGDTGNGKLHIFSTSDATTKITLRKIIVETAKRFIGIPYEFGAEVKSFDEIPKSIDCSELIESVFKIVKLDMPDGSQNQYNFTVSTYNPLFGDLAFFAREKNPYKIYHVGILYDNNYIIEARAHDPSCSFETGKVILRVKQAWENYKNFVGYRTHPKLIRD